jgi:hypothetical protein
MVSIVFLPVSAATPLITPDKSNIVKSTHSQHVPFPVELPKDLQPARPLAESEMMVIEIPGSWLTEKSISKDPDLVDISLPKTEFDAGFIRDTQGRYLSKQLKTGENPVILRIPRTMFDSLNTDPKTIRLSFPREEFTIPSDLAKEAGVSTLEAAGMGTAIPALVSPLANPVTHCTPETCAWRVSFAANQSGITYSTGSTTPLTYTHSGQIYQAYQELENYYDNGVTIEVIADYNSSNSGGIWIYPVVYNGENNNPVYPWVSPGNSEHLGGTGSYIPATTGVLSRSYEWYVLVNTGPDAGLYQIWLKDIRNNTWYYYDYTDTVNPATRLETSESSSELGSIYVGSPMTLYARTQVRNDWVMIGSVWKHPDEVYPTATFDFRSPDGVNWPPYVGTGYNWDNRAWNVFPMVEIPA